MDNETVKLRYPLLDCCGETPMIFRDTIAKILCIMCVKCGESVHAKPNETIQQLAERWNAAMLARRISETANEPENPLSYQVGGSHYKDLEYQPIEFFEDLHLDAFRANIIKYLARWRKKGGVEDLKKARHYAQIYQAYERLKCDAISRFVSQFPEDTKNAMLSVLYGVHGAAVSRIDQMIKNAEEARK